MIIRSLVCVLSVFFVVLVGCSRALELPEAKVTVKVVDELSNPVENADVVVGFQGAGPQGIKDIAVRGITGVDGVFSASGKTIDHIAYAAEKKGYYKSYVEYHFRSSNNGRWQPWNQEFTLVLRKIENPVPMYAREFRLELPINDKPVGFDLIEYDWVAPYGKGQYSDFIFKTTGSYVNEYEFDNKLEIYFSNKFDGIQLVKENRKNGSMLKLPKLAPYAGYNTKIKLRRSRIPGKPLVEDADDSNNYIFRIRSEEDSKKNIRAIYGKILGDIEFGVKKSKKTIVIFKYYLNPDYSNNLEFDIKENLFRNLPDLERVGLY